MTITDIKYKWNGSLTKRTSTKYIILHHRAGNGDVQSIHQSHIVKDYTGIGYHFYVRKDGKVYRGRPIYTVGAHCLGSNSNSIGVCFEGNFENEMMPAAQIKAGQELISYLKEMFPSASVKLHKDFNNTICPGKNFPFDTIKKGVIYKKTELKTVNDIVWELNHRGIMTDKELWSFKCITNSNAYWLAYKIVNYTSNLDTGKIQKLSTINDIVWELNHRGIITNTKLWLSVLKQDSNLYWLAYKAANFTKN